jgi:hypothetical protein
MEEQELKNFISNLLDESKEIEQMVEILEVYNQFIPKEIEEGKIKPEDL